MKLYIDGKEAVKGQSVKDFRGEDFILVNWREPLHSGSTGRVCIVPVSEQNDSNAVREVYPGVINAGWLVEKVAFMQYHPATDMLTEHPSGKTYPRKKGGQGR
jgi:hypothetical protein